MNVKTKRGSGGEPTEGLPEAQTKPGLGEMATVGPGDPALANHDEGARPITKGDTKPGVGEMATLAPGESAALPPGLVPGPGLVGTVIEEKYELIRMLGEGGMGAVFEAQHVVIGSRVAVKTLHPEAAGQPEALERFQREAQAAGTIGHPNIVRVHDIGQLPGGLPYMVMDFVEGQSLAEIVYTEAPLEPERAVSLAVQMLDALGAAHEKGIVHRDVKPENVQVSVDAEGREVARLLDFGISKFREIDPERQSLTRTGTILGTPLYMAPEQACGETDIDHRIDLYAVGVALYVMLTGRQPYTAPNYNALMVKIITEPPRPLGELNDELSPELVAVVEKSMAREREDRFSSAREFIDALEGKVTVEPPPPAARAGDGRRRSPWLAPGLALGAALILGAGLFFGLGGGDDDDRPTTAALVPAAADGGVDEADAGRVASGGGGADGRPPAVDEPAPAATVQVAFEAVPASATIRLNGREVSNPVREELPREEEGTVLIQVSARGYEPREQVFSLSDDVQEVIRLERRGRQPRSEPRKMYIKGVSD